MRTITFGGLRGFKAGHVWALLVGLGTSPALAQVASDSDFVSLDSVTYAAPLGAEVKFSLLVRLKSRTPAQVLTVPLSYAGQPNLRIDQTVVDAYGNKGVTQQSIGLNAAWWVHQAAVDTVEKSILIAYAALGSPLPPSDGPLVRVHFVLSPTATADTVWVDSTLFPPANNLALTDANGIEWTPRFTRGMIRLAFFGPWATGFTVGSPEDPQHLANHTPLISWQYTNFLGVPQASYQIECGTDADWSSAEMWQPGVQAGGGTSVTYTGNPLLDGQTYFGRVRVSDGTLWSFWTPVTFRMNTGPVTPVVLGPANEELLFTSTPSLSLMGSPDPEGDSLTYSFELYADSALTAPVSSGSSLNLPSWTTPVLSDNTRVWWRSRVTDGFEWSGFCGTRSFWVDGIPEPPGPVTLATPPNLGIVDPDNLLLAWHKVAATDPFDTLGYRLVVAHDVGLTSVVFQVNQADTARVLPDLLDPDATYYWRVTCRDQRPGDSTLSPVFAFNTGSTGDVDGSGIISSSDIIFLVNYVFRDGPAPFPLALGDVSGNCAVSATDIIYLVNFVFKSGLAPHVGCA